MKTPTENPDVHSLLDQLSDCLTPDTAERIANFRASAQTQAKIDELATKSNEGTLTEAEREEYEAFVELIDLISILQLKARRLLSNS